jgi:hypothetical protein
MRAARTSVVQGDQGANVNDLKLPAINVEKLIRSRSSPRLVDQFCVVIALVPVGRRSKEPETQFPLKQRPGCSAAENQNKIKTVSAMVPTRLG